MGDRFSQQLFNCTLIAPLLVGRAAVHFSVLGPASPQSPSPVFSHLHIPLPVLFSTQTPETNLSLFCELGNILIARTLLKIKFNKQKHSEVSNIN